MAPEILKGVKATPKADIFSLGSLFYTLVTRRLLFEGKDIREVLSKNKH